MLQKLVKVTAMALLLLPFSGYASDSADKALVLVNSGDTQTQGMAMVLSGAMLAQGADVRLLLCDAAGDMAVKENQGETLKPFNATPGERLQGLINDGVVVELCALYLPNSGLAAEDIIDGVNPRAQPPEIARLMLQNDTKVFSF